MFNLFKKKSEKEVLQEKYQKLMKDQCLLNCLHIAGVDNWEGYYEAIEIFNEEEEDA